MSQAVENVLRLVLAAALGAVIGVERERNEQPAGLRTNLLVALGACLFTLMSAYGVDRVAGDVRNPIRVDPSRIASQVVVGIGFLGAGAILKHGLSIRGLTTAASLWVVAGIGMATGFGAYDLAVATTVIAVVALYILRPARRWVRHLGADREELRVHGGESMNVESVLQAVRDAGGSDLRLEVAIEGDGERAISVEAKFPSHREFDATVGAIAALDGVLTVGPPDRPA